MSLFFVTTVFFFSTMVLVFSPTTYGQESAIQQSESTGVASKATNVSLKSTDSCKESLGANDLAKAKAYSKDRLDKRLNSTKVIEKSINSNYDKIDSTYTSKMSSIQSIINKYAKGSKTKVEKENLSKAKSKLLKQTDEINKIIEQGRKGAQSAQTSPEVANYTCDAIFNGAVYSKLVPTVRGQLKLDAVKMRNSLNQGRYTAINALYKENTSTLKSEKSGIDKLDNPKSYNDEIKALQSRIDAGENVVKDVTSFAAKPKKSAPEITKQLSEQTAKLREEKQAKSSNASSAGGSSSQNSGTGSTRASSNIREKVIGKNDSGKPTSGRFCYPNVATTGKSSCVSYGGDHKKTRKEAINEARAKAKKIDEEAIDKRTKANAEANSKKYSSDLAGPINASAAYEAAKEKKESAKKRKQLAKDQARNKKLKAKCKSSGKYSKGAERRGDCGY